MPQEVTSKHLRGATELTLVADVTPGFVETLETTSFTTRIGLLLRTLFAIRQKAIEASQLGNRYEGPLEKLQSLHFVRWSLLEDGRKLMLAVSFDGPWEPYMRRIADVAGPLLDVILCSCEKYAATDQGYRGFEAWVREHQVKANFFHADSPELSADDVRFLKELESQQRQEPNLERFDEAAARLRTRDLSQPPPAAPNMTVDDTQKTWQAELAALEALYALVAYFPKGDPTGGDVHLQRTAHLILPHFEDTPVPPLFEKRHARALQWYHSLAPRTEPTPEASDIKRPKTVQGNILAPYDGMTHGCIALLRIADRKKARRALCDLSRRLTYADATLRPGTLAINAAFTSQGLKTLGLDDDQFEKLPKEFREGMEARAGLLGDVGPNHPDHWQRPKLIRPRSTLNGTPVDLASVDLVLFLQKNAGGRKPHQDHSWHKGHPLAKPLDRILGKSGLDLLAVEVQRREPSRDGYVREHFGFRDGISQPKPGGSPTDPDTVPLGEILLGYPNDRGDSNEAPLDFMKNGSFLVVRKLEQHVDRFQSILANYSDQPRKQDQLAARMMGRFPDGRPVVDDALPADENDFVYDRDRNTPCPPAAHIRRANPRTARPGRSLAGTRPAPIPRIMRRGFSYGRPYAKATEKQERGLFFLAYNASISEQFEVIQRWISGGNSSGALSSDSDPFLGLPKAGAPERTFRNVVGSEVERVSLGKHPLVSLRWGMYLFAPSKEGFRQLAEGLPLFPTLPVGDAKKGEELIRKLEFLHVVEKLRDSQRKKNEPHADEILRDKWKQLIEDIGAQAKSQHMWAAVRARGGAVRTPYGVLLGSEQHVMQAFADYKTFSAREYWARMKESIGELYLGMDRAPQKTEDTDPGAVELDEAYRAALRGGRYQKESAFPNEWIENISGREAFLTARKTTKKSLEEIARPDFGERTTFDVRRLVGDVLAELSRYWFALPDGVHMSTGGPVPEPDAKVAPHCPENFLSTARYIFSPNPTAYVVEDGKRKGLALKDAAVAYVKETYESGEFPENTLFEAMAARHASPTAKKVDLVARTLVGSVHGFVGPGYGTLVSVLYMWTIATRQLWARQSSLSWDKKHLARHQAFWNLAHAFVSTMQLRPLPYILHRTVTAKKDLQLTKPDGSTAQFPLEPGDRVVMGLLSGTRDVSPVDPTVLFGGNSKRSGAPIHACPGQEMAMGAMLGILWALLEFGPYEGEAPFILSTPAKPSPPGKY